MDFEEEEKMKRFNQKFLTFGVEMSEV